MNVGTVSAHVVRCRPNGAKLEAALIVGLRPTLKSPSRHRAIVFAEIETVLISVIGMNDHALCRCSSIGRHDLAFDDEWDTRLCRHSDATLGGYLRRSSLLRFVPTPKPERISLAKALASAEQSENDQKR